MLEVLLQWNSKISGCDNPVERQPGLLSLIAGSGRDLDMLAISAVERTIYFRVCKQGQKNKGSQTEWEGFAAVQG